ncbi:uncharacterized protein [Polyergus mexicanus]|uniref:uncharacterized protein n=1 Tax=Polyergus mexicanus TaxID=615972 RepID=UPI0038B58EFF
MSEGSNIPKPIANRSWLLSEPARRAIKLSLAPRENSYNVRKNLETQYSSESEPELPENVVTEREFPFNNFDESLFPRNTTDPTDDTQRETRRTRPYISRTPSRVSLRREFSLTSYESDLFDPEEIYSQQESNMAESRNPRENTPANLPQSAVDEEIERMRRSIHQMDRNIVEADHTPPHERNREEKGDYTQIIHILNEIRADIHSLNIRVTRLESADAQLPRHTDINRENDNDAFETTYGRTGRDIRNRRSVAPNYLPLKEARMMIPEFDGTSRHKLQEFLNACKYAVQNINPADEESLIQAILFTKLKGKAMQDFETRDIQTFDELKQQLETCYQSKQSTTHLQIEFNSLKQKPNETAYAFGQRVDLLAMKLYDSMIEGQEHSALSKRTIQQTIQAQALINFQIGLHDELQVLVRAQRYTTLQEAITGASAEEKLRPGTARTSGFANKNKTEFSYSRNSRSSNSQCFKCGKNGHFGRDCRSSRYALPKPEKPSRINAINKYCSHCKRTGHSRDECWSLKGKPKNNTNKLKVGNQQKTRDENIRDRKKPRQQNRNADSASSSSEDEQEEARKRQPRPASEYRVTHIKDMPRAKKKTDLLLITLPMRQAKDGKIQMLYDSGSTISLIKLKQLKDDTLIHEGKIALTGITGHKIHTIGKMYATIKMDNHKVKHAFYVVRDDIPIEYEGIIGIDFLRQHSVSCDYNQNQLKIGDAVLRFHTFNKTILKPRSETIVKAITKQNRIGIVRAEETAPGIYLGNCLVEPKDYTCPVSIINTTDTEVEIQTPNVTLEDIEREIKSKIHTIQARKNFKPTNSRHGQI